MPSIIINEALLLSIAAQTPELLIAFGYDTTRTSVTSVDKLSPNIVGPSRGSKKAPNYLLVVEPKSSPVLGGKVGLTVAVTVLSI